MDPVFFPANLLLSLAIFSLGVMGVLWHRNALSVFMSIELMLNAGNLALISFAQRFGDSAGAGLVLFVMTVAAAEAGVGLAIFIRLYRQRSTVELDKADELQG
ncbi:MAG: NADH-quinone oxidoreductase subunit NuoK [Candidatus Sumerlaeia bacterium]|nr:NADH-quinone oxidoreductase subunit NuoK [Candidatus Sumerlaeia bacterium]